MGTYLLFLAVCATLTVMYLYTDLQTKRTRASYFASAVPLFQKCHVIQTDRSWPVLTGEYGGASVRLEPIFDDLSWRKVPSLWLKVTVFVSNPSRGTLGFLVRPRGCEFYSPTAEMKYRLPIPENWPTDALLCTDKIEAMPSCKKLLPATHVFHDQRVKELVITPRGIRLVYQAAQAERSDYLVMRRARFSHEKADPNLVSGLLDSAIAIAAMADA
jgi:hypothetical protein